MTNEERFSIRMKLEASGCAVAGYDGKAFQLQIMRGKLESVIEAAKAAGLKPMKDLFYFPLGSDNPPQEFRHWCGRYTPENGFKYPGFWLYARFEADSMLCE